MMSMKYQNTKIPQNACYFFTEAKRE